MVVYFIFKIVQHAGSGVEMVHFHRGRGNKVTKFEILTVRAFSYYNLLGIVAQANEGYDIFMAQVGLLEDNARIARLCATLLQYAGHQVTVYYTPQQCLHALLSHVVCGQGEQRRTLESVPACHAAARSSSLPVEVLILDLALPEISGIEVLRSLTSHPYTRTLPIILCTAATTTEVARALQVAPHASFVEKPFKLQTLVSAISTALDTAAK